MKAIVMHQYGSPDVLKMEEVEKPVPKEDEVVVKIHAAAVNAADWHIMRGEPFMARLMFGLFKPKIKVLGADIAGTVEAVGSNVKQFKPGDEVFADVFSSGFGGFAEYTRTFEKNLVLKPAGISFEEAAALPVSAVTAYQALHYKGKIQQGQKVLINGASGGVGTFAVQIAKSAGAEVTGVCSTKKLEKIRALGADQVIDYTKEDFTKNGRHYDLIIGANGYHPIMDYKRSLNPGGVYVTTGGTNKQMFQGMLVAPFVTIGSNKKMGNMLAKPNRNDLTIIKDLVVAGKVKPVIDRRYTLAEVPDAIRYLEEGHAYGKVIITIS